MGKIEQWALDLKQEGTEIKKIGEKYYLYTAPTTRYSKEDKKPHKVPGKYIGRLVEGFGLLKKGERESAIRGKVSAQVRLDSHAVYGLAATVPTLFIKEVKRLKKWFGDDWQSMVAFSEIRLGYHCPMKDMSEHWAHDYLGTAFTDAHMSDDALSPLLRRVGANRAAIAGYLSDTPCTWDTIAFDGTDIFSKSKNIGISKLQKTKQGSFDTVFNIMFAFSLGMNMPIFYKLFRGNIKDVKSFLLTLIEAGYRSVIILADKGFYSEDNIKELDTLELNYVIPLRRDCSMIDYTPTVEDIPAKDAHIFQYNGRKIFGYKQSPDQDHDVYLFLDPDMRDDEASAMRKRIEDTDGASDGQSEDDKNSWDRYRELHRRMGTIAFLVPRKMEERLQREKKKAEEEAKAKRRKNAKENEKKTEEEQKPIVTPKFVYGCYKKRGAVEEEIDVYKNFLHADRTYMQDAEAEEGWTFLNFVSLQWYYRILNQLEKSKVDDKYSCRAAISFLCEVEKGKINGEWHNFPLTGKETELFDALGLSWDAKIDIP